MVVIQAKRRSVNVYDTQHTSNTGQGQQLVTVLFTIYSRPCIQSEKITELESGLGSSKSDEVPININKTRGQGNTTHTVYCNAIVETAMIFPRRGKVIPMMHRGAG